MSFTLAPNYIKGGLILDYDVDNAISYPGSGTSIFDLTAYGNTGTLVNGVTYDGLTKSLVLNGVNQYISLPNTKMIVNAHSIDMWVWSSNFAQTNAPLYENWHTGLGASSTSIYINAGNLYFISTSVNSMTIPVTNLTANAWNQITCTFDGAYMKIYINSVLIATSTWSSGVVFRDNTNLVRIGGSGSPSMGYFNGKIGNYRVYNRALSQLDITTLYNFFGSRYGYTTTPIPVVTFGDNSVQVGAFNPATDRGGLISVMSFTASGTWTKPVGCTKVKVEVVGGGGGGSGYCESGGGGGYSSRLIDVSNINTVAVTVGGGGAGAAYASPGTDGGTSSFGTYCSATGGYGANRNVQHAGGLGGTGLGGDVNLTGGTGTGHCDLGNLGVLGSGGASILGGGGTVNRGTNSTKVAPGAPGAGGPGGRTDGGTNGTAGESGMVIVYNYA